MWPFTHIFQRLWLSGVSESRGVSSLASPAVGAKACLTFISLSGVATRTGMRRPIANPSTMAAAQSGRRMRGYRRSKSATFCSTLAWGALCAISVLFMTSGAASGTASSAPQGTIGVATPADFKVVLLISPTTGAVTRTRAPDNIVGQQVDLSRSGTRIAFGGTKGVWITHRRGTGGRVVVSSRSGAFAPDWVVWSPSGRALAFTRGESLFTVSTNGTGLRKLLGPRTYAPDWSPAGSPIVFVRSPSLKTGVGLIQSIEVVGHNVRSIVRGGHPDVSPDGMKLAFARRDGVYVMPLRGGKPQRIVARGEHPEWSPDGLYLAFTREVRCRDAGCQGRVFIIPATGGLAHPIGPRIFEIGPLSWSN